MLRLTFVLLALVAGVRLERVQVGRIGDDHLQSGINRLFLAEQNNNDGITERSKREFLHRTPIEEDIDVTSEEFAPREIRKRCNPVHRHKSLMFDDSETLYRLIDLLNEERNVHRNLNRRRSYTAYPRTDTAIIDPEDPMTSLAIPRSIDEEAESDIPASDLDLDSIAYKLALSEKKNRLRSRECDHKRMICYCQDEDCENPEKNGIVRLALSKRPFSIRKKPKKIGFKDKAKPSKGSYLDQLNSLQNLPVLVPLHQNAQSNVMDAMHYIPINKHPNIVDFADEEENEPKRYHIPFAVSDPNRPGLMVGSVQVMSQDRQQGKKCGMQVGQARKKCSGNKSKNNNKPVYDKQRPENVGSTFGNRKQDGPPELFDFEECMKHHTADVCMLASVRRTMPTEDEDFESGQKKVPNPVSDLVGVTQNSADSEHSQANFQGRVTHYENKDHSGNGINDESSSFKSKVDQHYAPYHMSYEEAKDRKIEGGDYKVLDLPTDSGNLAKVPYKEHDASKINYAKDYGTYKPHSNTEHGTSQNVYNNKNTESGKGRMEAEQPRNTENQNSDDMKSQDSPTMFSNIHEVTNGYFTSRDYENETNLTGLDADGNKIAHYNELNLINPTAEELPNKNQHQAPSTETQPKNSVIEQDENPSIPHDPTFVKNLIKKVINDIALNRSDTVGDVMHIKNLKEHLHPCFVNIPSLKHMILSPPVERTVINRVNNHMSDLVGAKRRLPAHQIRKYLHHVVGGPEAAPGNPRFTVEEHQLHQGTWTPHRVSLLQQDPSNSRVEPATRLRDRVMYFLNNPMHRHTINHPVARNMIAESVKNDMAEENDDSTGIINDTVISRFLDRIFGVSDDDQKPVIVQPRPELVQETTIVNNEDGDMMDPTDDEEMGYEDQDVVGSSKQNLNKQKFEERAKIENGGKQQSREKDIGVLMKDQYETKSTTEFPTSPNFDRKLSVTEHSVKKSTYKDEEKVNDVKLIESSPRVPQKSKGFESSTSTSDDANLGTRTQYDEDKRPETIETAPIKYYSPEGQKLNYVKTHSSTPENENTESPTLATKVSEPSSENPHYLPTENTKAVGKTQTVTNKISESKPILDPEQKEDTLQTSRKNDVVEESSKASVNSDAADKKSVFTEDSTSGSRYEVRAKTTGAVEGDKEKLTTVHYTPIEPENKRLTTVVTQAPENKFGADEKMYRTDSGNLYYAGPSTENINESHATFAGNKGTKSQPEAESEPTETSNANVKMENPNYAPVSEAECGCGKSTIYDERYKNVITENPVVKNKESSAKTEESPVQGYQHRYTSVNYNYVPTERTENKKDELVGVTLGTQSNLNENTYSKSSVHVTSDRVTTEMQPPSHVHTERIPVEESVVQGTGRSPENDLENREKMLYYERNKYAQSPTARAEYDASMASHPSAIPHYQERLTSVYYTPSIRLPESTENVHKVEIDQTNAPDARNKVPETEFGSGYYTTPFAGKAKLEDPTILSEKGGVPEEQETQTEKVLTSEPATIIVKNFSPSTTTATIAQDENRRSSVYEHQITEMPNLMTSGYPHMVHTYDPKISEIVRNEEVLPVTHHYPTEHTHKIYEHYPSSTSRVEAEKSQTSYYTSSPYEKTQAPVVTLTVRHETQPEIEEMTENPRLTLTTEGSVEAASRRPTNYNKVYKDASTVGRSQFEVTERSPSPETGTNYKVTVYYTPTEKTSENTRTESTSAVPAQHRTYTEKYETSPGYEIRSEIRVTENPQKDGAGFESKGRTTQTGRIVSEEQRISPQVTESSTSLSEREMQMQARTGTPITSEKVTQMPNTDRFEDRILAMTQTPEIAKSDQQLPIVYYSPTEGKYHMVENSVTGEPTDRNKNLVFTMREMVDKANAANAHRTTVSTEKESSKTDWGDEGVKPTEQILDAVQLIENSTPSSADRMLTQGQTQETPSITKDKDVTFERIQTTVSDNNENLPTTKVPGRVMPIAYYSPSEQKYKYYNDPGTTERTEHSKGSTAEMMYTSDHDQSHTNRPFERINFPRTTMSTREETTDFRSRVDQVPRVQTASHVKDATRASTVEHPAPSTERGLTQVSAEPISYDSTSKKTNDPVVGKSQEDVRSSTMESSRTYEKSVTYPTDRSMTLNPLIKNEVQEPKTELPDSAVRKGDLKSNYHTTTFLERTSTPGTIRSEKENTEVLPDVGELGQNEKDLFVDDKTQRVTTEHSTPVMESSAINDERPRASTNYERVTEPGFRQMSTESRYKIQSTSKTEQSRYQSTSHSEKTPVTYYSTTEGILKYTQNRPSAVENAEIIENLPGENKGKVYKTYFGSTHQTMPPVQKAITREMIISEDKGVEETTPEVRQTTPNKAFTTPQENVQTSFTQSSASRHDTGERIMTDAPIVAQTRSPELTKDLNGEINEIYLPTEKDLESSTTFKTTEDFAYFGKISLGNEANPSKELSDLESSDLYYIGDGVKLPLEIRRLKDGSYALSISSKICKNFMNKECPCCVPRDGKILRTKRTLRGKRSSRNSLEMAMPVSTFAKKYNLALDIDDKNLQLSGRTGDQEMSLEEKNNEKLNGLTDPGSFVTEIFKMIEGEGSGEGAEESVGYRYDVNNPFLDRSRFVKKVQGEHMQNEGQRSTRGYYADRMEDMRNFLLWLKALILSSD